MAITHNYLDTYNIQITFQSKGSYIRYISKIMTEKRSSTANFLSAIIAGIKYFYYLTIVLIDIFYYFIWLAEIRPEIQIKPYSFISSILAYLQ